jgi:hypothetical protein
MKTEVGMTTGFMETEIKRNNRSLLILSLLCLLAVGVSFLLSVRYLYNFVLGPFNTTSDAVTGLQAESRPLQYFVKITGDDVADTGYDWISESSSGTKTVEATYLAMFLGERILLVKSPTSYVDGVTTFSGKLTSIPGEIQSDVVTALENEYPDLQGAFLPLMLDAGNFRSSGYLGLAAGAFFALLGLFGLTRSLIRMDVSRHPVMKQLENLGTPQFITSRIDMEMGGDHLKIGPLHISQNWLVQSQMSAMRVSRMEDLVWGYKLVTQHRTNGVPTGKTYQAMIFNRNGTQFTLPGKEKDVDRLLSEVYQRAPWMITGFSQELAKAWSKDRPALIASVDSRRMGQTANR